ncbi:MAG TPA: hypothetical protein DCS35_12770, partial [Vibrio sp.]|nr:hypothetical protein [Vibrio sp.]
MRVARNILRAHSDEPWNIEFSNILDAINITEQLEKAGIDSGMLNAYEMSCQQQQRGANRYLQWLDVYSEIT